ncbi:MAG TPA: PTS sugar transporter subunit IIA [Thermoanaerobaculia bacterium]|nr:PTS sugar transporter subunit IIA [Thermoanaerobaculia bacterium]
MRLESLTRPELIFPHLHGGDRSAVLHALAQEIARDGTVKDPEELFRLLEEREDLGSTGIGGGVAIPHCKVSGLEHVTLAVGLCNPPVDFNAVDREPVSVIFLVLSPVDSPAEHLQSLAAISRWVKSGDHIQRLRHLDEAQAIYDLLVAGGS